MHDGRVPALGNHAMLGVGARDARQRDKDRTDPRRCAVYADDFQARSSDELTLAKGDRVELIERDDEFGDGWFLGKHMANGNTGLFPEGMALFCLATPTAGIAC